jgi:hypothetical protein
MSPVIGHSGVVALYRRSLHMVATGHPWLAALRVTQPPAMDLPAMRVVLVGQCAADAAAAATALSTTLHGLLVSLIGEALTHRLLLPVWANTLRGSSAPETTP